MARVKVERPIPRRYIDGYADSLEMISEEMKRRLTSALEAVDYARPVAEVREALIPIMQAHVYESRALAAQAAAEFYDGLREWETGERMGAVAYDGYDPVPVERRVRSSVQPLAEAQKEFYWADDIRLDETYQEELSRRAIRELVQALCEYTGYSVKAAAGGTVFGNGRRDPRGVRFARVPRGSKSYPGGCPFCQMLASRGFRYRSELTAGSTDPDHYHDDCQCMVVPSWGPGSVEGYDPRAYDQGYQEYLDQDHSRHDERVREAQRNRYDERGRLKSGDGNRLDEKGAITDEDRARIRSMRTAKGNATRKARRERYFSDLGVTESEWKAMSEAQQRALLDRRSSGKIGRNPNSVGAMRYRSNRSSSVILNDEQFGHKAGKHCRDWGLDPSNREDREKLLGIIEDIIDSADEIVVGNTWRDQPQPCVFYRKGRDLVIINGDGEYVTIMKDGAGNRRFLRAREEAQNDRATDSRHTD